MARSFLSSPSLLPLSLSLLLLLLFSPSLALNTTCETSLSQCESSLSALQSSYDSCGCGVDPCSSEEGGNYDLGFHVASVFIILAASLLGAGVPILAAYVPWFRIPKFAIVLGKCMGIGVILACSLIHMLLPANESLTSSCLPAAFSEDYEAYAFLFAMIAGLMMQLVDFLVLGYATRYFAEEAGRKAAGSQYGSTDSTGLEKKEDGEEKKDGEKDLECKVEFHQHEGHSHEGHSHGLLLDSRARKTVEAYLLEFGVTVHSIFVGLAVGVVDDSSLRGLLVALVFHQFFEGLALGSRIADAKLPTHWHEAILSIIFSISAPLGIMVGILVAFTMNPNGETFLLVQGIFDAVCAGILLYIGYSMLLKDFNEDLRVHCEGKNGKRSAMFGALWIGAGFMAFIGKYL